VEDPAVKLDEALEMAYPQRVAREMAQWLEAFHTRLAEALHDGKAVLDLLPE
jgi:hypothetical protein